MALEVVVEVDGFNYIAVDELEGCGVVFVYDHFDWLCVYVIMLTKI